VGGGPDNVAFAALQTVTNTAQVVNYDPDLMDGQFFMEAEYRRIGNYRAGANLEYTTLNVTQVVMRATVDGLYYWPVKNTRYRWIWDGTTHFQERYDRLEASTLTEQYGDLPIATYLLGIRAGKKVPGAYVDFVVRLLDGDGNVIDEKSQRIYIQQVVKMEWEDKALDALEEAGTVPNPVWNPNQIGLANMDRATARAQIETGVKVYFHESQIGASLNVLFVNEETPLCDKADYKVLRFERGSILLSGLGDTQTQNPKMWGLRPYGLSRVFVKKIIDDYYDFYPLQVVNATPLYKRNDECCYSISRVAGHETGHNLGLVYDSFNTNANTRSHYKFNETLDPTSFLMNDPAFIIFDSFSGRRDEGNWTEYDKSHLRTAFPHPPTP